MGRTGTTRAETPSATPEHRKTPRRNRVDPWGRLVATAARGTLMGNRGRLHDDSGRILKDQASTSWIICSTEFNGRKRELMAPGSYTELFFLDEATALAAGHRPCFTCRRPEARQFLELYRKVCGRDRSLDDLDRALAHDRRISRSPLGTGKRAYQARIDDLPRGAMVELSGTPHLVVESGLRPWSFEGYGAAAQTPDDAVGWVLTPRTTVRILSAGYPAGVHESARS